MEIKLLHQRKNKPNALLDILCMVKFLSGDICPKIPIEQWSDVANKCVLKQCPMEVRSF